MALRESLINGGVITIQETITSVVSKNISIVVMILKIKCEKSPIYEFRFKVVKILSFFLTVRSYSIHICIV
jgi:hypothetical protein